MIKTSGFRIDTKVLNRKLAKIKKQIRAETFKPILMDFIRKSLNKAIKLTPARELSVIKQNQSRQYDRRVNYIPSYHTLENPSLIIKPDGSHWLYLDDQWYRVNQSQIPQSIQGAYFSLLSEHQRRLQTSRSQFIKERSQSRGLYKKSWSQVGESIGLSLVVPAVALRALTRRKPAQEPPRGYAQVRGGNLVLNVVIFNPLLNQKSKYKKFDSAEIIGKAMAQHRTRYLSQMQKQFNRVVYAIFQTA